MEKKYAPLAFSFLSGDNFNIKDVVGHFNAGSGDSTINLHDCFLLGPPKKGKNHLEKNMII